MYIQTIFIVPIKLNISFIIFYRIDIVKEVADPIPNELPTS